MNAPLFKNTDNLIQCSLGECTTKDVFFIALFANAAMYRIVAYDLMGRIKVKSVSGVRTTVLEATHPVWRKKRLIEALEVDNNDPQGAFGEVEEKKTERLIDTMDDTTPDNLLADAFGLEY